MTPRTHYLRFQYAKSYFSEEEADYYTHVTPPERGAYVAALSEGQEERIIAVGRWDVTPGQDSAEVALVVEDDVQFRGIGTSLLEQLPVAASDFNISLSKSGENVRLRCRAVLSVAPSPCGHRGCA